MANRLLKEQSLYLQQHANNPVDWYPWGSEAFDRAQKEHKPLLVSIGYAACHWCHVMEHESFEDDATAAYMNEHFINIKVDREEHPDVDSIYMDAVQAITGAGGWPLNVFVTPDRVPFYGGTYFPPKSMYGRLSWMEVLQKMKKIWEEQYDDVAMQSDQMLQYLKQASMIATKAENKSLDKDVCQAIAKSLLGNADAVSGGFGKAPKFPATMAIKCLLDHYHFAREEKSLVHALLSLDAMIEGGIYDQLGGGFARYATDNNWLVPHFEKMLYDNALIVGVLADAYVLTGKERYKEVIIETVAFCDRELANGYGGYYCSLDADSEGVEGRYYTFSWEEWQTVVDDDAVTAYYGITEAGNWEGVNILHVTRSKEQVAQDKKIAVEDLEQRISVAKEKLRKYREVRIRPATDDKSLLSWNALMNTALVKAAMALQSEQLIDKAVTQMRWMMEAFFVDNKVFHTWKEGDAKIDAKLDDMAYLIQALIELSSATGNGDWIAKAHEILTDVNAGFLHEDRSFYYYTSIEQKDIPVRKVDVYDGAIPSANSVMADNLIRLGMCYEKNNWIEQGEYMLKNMVANTSKYATSFANWGVYIQQQVYGSYTVVVTGENAFEQHAKLSATYTPNALKLVPGKTTKELPVLAHKNSLGGSELYICNKEYCLPPVSSVEEAANILKGAK